MDALQAKRPTIANWFSSLRRQPKNKKKATLYNGLSDDKHLQRSCFDLSANSTFYVPPLETATPDINNDEQTSTNTSYPAPTAPQNAFQRSSSENCAQNNEHDPLESNNVAQICARCYCNLEQSPTFTHPPATPTKTTQRISHTVSTCTRVSPQQSITTNTQTKFAQDYCRSESRASKPNSPTTLLYSKTSELKRISKTTTTKTLIISRPVQLVLNEKGEIVEKQPFLLETKPRSNSLDCVLNEQSSEEDDTQVVRSSGESIRNPNANRGAEILCKECRKVAERNLSNAVKHGPPESPVIMRNHKQIKDELVEVVSEMEALDVPEDSKHSNKDKQMSIGRKKFNMDPKKGIEYLVEHNLLRHDAQDVAHFLYKGEGLNKTAIGDFLGEKNDFNEDVLRAFVELHDFTNLILVQALRQFLWSFRLPGEAQKIDRMMECFAQRYCQLNPDIFTNTDTCYVLSFAIIMLNTSLHNPSVKDKPTVEQFISMNRGINNGGDLPRGLLESLYESIRTEPFKIPQDDGNDLMHTFFNPDKEGWLWKQGGRYKSWKRRWFILNDNCLYYFEYTTDKEPRGIIPLENISVREIHDRSKPFCFELFATGGADIIKACKTDSEGKVVEGKHTVYRMSAATAEEQQDWIKRLTQSISHNPFYDILVQRKKKALSKS